MVVQFFAVMGDLGIDAVFRIVHFLPPDAEPVDGDGEGGERGGQDRNSPTPARPWISDAGYGTCRATSQSENGIKSGRMSCFLDWLIGGLGQ